MNWIEDYFSWVEVNGYQDNPHTVLSFLEMKGVLPTRPVVICVDEDEFDWN